MKGLFLDRDGVINIDHGYVHSRDKFTWRIGIFFICKIAQLTKHKIIIVTNQAGIAKGIYTTEQFIKLTKYMLSIFTQKRINIECVYYCPYHQSGKIKEFKKNSHWRKPQPGMIEYGIKFYELNARKSIMIGDQQSDKEAARSGGIDQYIDATGRFWVIKACTMLIGNSIELIRRK